MRRIAGLVGSLSQSKNVAYALDSARIQISLGLRQHRVHWIQARWVHLEQRQFRPSFDML
jgi:hypothetical protein